MLGREPGGGFCNRVRGKRAGEDAAIPELHKKEIDAYIDSIVLYVTSNRGDETQNIGRVHDSTHASPSASLAYLPRARTPNSPSTSSNY